MPSHKTSPQEQRAALVNWESCNDYLRNATEDEARKLLEVELHGAQRMQYVLRIHARYNKMRAARERIELIAKLGG